MAGWFIRVYLHALFVDCSGSSVDSSVVELSNSSAKILASVLVNDSNDLWGDIYFQGVKTLAPRLAPIVTRMLPHLIQQRPLNYAVLRYRFCMMTSMASMSDTCNAIFLRHRAVYFTTCFLRHLYKILHPRRAGMIISEETKNDVIQCWVWCIKYLRCAFKYGGYESIILALNSGLLQALWGLVEGHMNMRESNPGHQFPSSELIRDVLNLLSASSLYRSVHKPLERILDKLPLDRTHSSDESGQIWRDFKLLVKNRAELRRRWEEKKITLCSNLGCRKSSPMHNTKVFRCSGCTITFYCGRLCQKSDWMHGHRKKCRKYAEDQVSLPRDAENRDRKLIYYIAHSELWSVRHDLIQQQNNHRNLLELPSVQAEATILISVVDFTKSGTQFEVEIYTLDEAKRAVPGTSWDGIVSMFRRRQSNHMDDTAMILALIPHPAGEWHLPLILIQPDVELVGRSVNVVLGKVSI
ncbi:hypothetical protein BT96DRAFT_406223 [Gymnopus androsaceus JB14]|uniref:MYND-type domain-containing protein n=1 Tax=Gymnopus androsaceus JB14 TaxID=1447944 RepID=A0A6A4I2N1_9AGAR|nr:hypothetical protein BT96DRAFT_406223 [Gymnopus androsaceus JB14]